MQEFIIREGKMYFDDMKIGMTVNVAPAVIDKDKMLEFAKVPSYILWLAGLMVVYTVLAQILKRIYMKFNNEWV